MVQLKGNLEDDRMTCKLLTIAGRCGYGGLTGLGPTDAIEGGNADLVLCATTQVIEHVTASLPHQLLLFPVVQMTLVVNNVASDRILFLLFPRQR